MRQVGIISILFEDIGDVETTAYATTSVSLSMSTEQLEEADPDAYGFRKFFPGQQSWRASSSYNEVILANLSQHAAQIALEELAFARTRFVITFTSAAGRTYTGRTWIRSLGLPTVDQGVFLASIEFVGIGELVPTGAAHPLFDPEDLILLLPDSITLDNGDLTLWTNLGSILTDGDLTQIIFGGDTLSDGENIAGIGDVAGVGVNNEDFGVSSVGIVPTIDGIDDDSEMWLIIRTTATGQTGEICGFHGSTLWQIVGGKFSFSVGGSERFGDCPSIYDDSAFHVYRTIHNLSNNVLVMTVDGYPLGSKSYSGAMSGMATGTFHIGPHATGPATGMKYAAVKLLDGQLSQSRSRAIYAYLRDTWGITSIPADGTATVGITGSPYSNADIQRVPFLAGSTQSIMHNGSSTNDFGTTIRKDDANEFIYFTEGHGARAKLLRSGYAGDDFIEVTTTHPISGLNQGLAINLVAEEAYVSHRTNGSSISKHTMDPADFAVAWTEILATGTYEMRFALEYHPANDLVYFIDSLAATPTLRSITTAGASDTLVKSLTAGKVYEYLTKDPDANVFYFTNSTDNTIEKYDLGTDTHTVAWHTPTNKPNGIDIQNGKLWYLEETTGFIYEVALTTPGSKINKGTSGGGDWAGLIVVVFDTTA